MNIDAAIKQAVADAVAPLVSEIKDLKRKIDPPKEWHTPKEAAKAHGVCVSTIYRWADEGKIEAKGAGKSRRFRF